MINRRYIFFLGAFLLLFLVGLVLASSTALNSRIEGNVTSLYDEGIFTVNWTAGGDAAANYTIYLWMNDHYVSGTQNANTSATGYKWSNRTEANYTFMVEAVNATGFRTNSTKNVSMYVDHTAPVIKLPNYSNTTSKKNTALLTLNIFVADALSGITGSVCLIDVNGTSNQTIDVASGWCNSTSISLAGSTDGNHTLNVYANDTVNNVGLNDSYVVQIDTTAPVIALPNYVNASYKKNTDTLTLNISVADATSGITGSVCLIDVNGTSNQTIDVASGWCNSTLINLTGSADGDYVIKVYVNDTNNNLGLNDSYIVKVDTTAPVVALTQSTLTSTSVSLTFSTTEDSCVTNRGTLSGRVITDTSLECASTHSYTITCTDNAGNVGTYTKSFTTYDCGDAGGVGSSTTSTSYWQGTFVVNANQFSAGYTKELPIKNRMRVVIGNEDHYVGVVGLTGTTAKINISSDSQQITLSVGGSQKFDLTGDNVYDLLVTLNSISSNKANITVLSISEKIPSSVKPSEETASGENTAGNTVPEYPNAEKKTNLLWLWIALGLIVIIVIIYFATKKKPKRRYIKL